MKKQISLLLLAAILSFQAQAQILDHARAYIVVQDVQHPDDFFIERVPVVGCHTQSSRPQLQQLTAAYRVPVSRGCGMTESSENINVLTCAKIHQYKESRRDGSLYHLSLDVSGCEAKNNPRFITTVRRAIALNFPQPNGQIQFQMIRE